MAKAEHASTDLTVGDGTRLVAESWAPEGQPKFVVCVAHGNSEHMGRYGDVAADFNEAGGYVFGVDRRGQGESGGAPGHVDSFDVFVSDLRFVLAQKAEALPESMRPNAVPWFLLGHSAGGLIALLHLLDKEQEIPLRGTIISNPLLGLAMKVSPVTATLGRMAARFAPKLLIASNIPASAVSRDPEVVARYEADPRRVRKVSTRWFVEMTAAADRVKANVSRIVAPLLWAVGTGDQICDHQESLQAFSRLTNPADNDQHLEVFDGYYHELHNEPPAERAKLMSTYLSWITERLS